MKSNKRNIVRLSESMLKSMISESLNAVLNEISYDMASDVKNVSYNAFDKDPEDVKDAITLIYNVLESFKYDVGPSNRMGGSGRQINDVIESFKVVDKFITRKLIQYENLESHEENKYLGSYEEIGKILRLANPTKENVEEYLNNMSDEEYEALLNNLPKELRYFLENN